MTGLCPLIRRPKLAPALALYHKAVALVDAIVDPHEADAVDDLGGLRLLSNDKVFRCHEIARAVGQVLKLPVQDGWYGAIEHSWLWIPQEGPSSYGFEYDAILDVYAVGRLPMVQLVMSDRSAGHYAAGGLGASLYREGPPRKDIRTEVHSDILNQLRVFQAFGKPKADADAAREAAGPNGTWPMTNDKCPETGFPCYGKECTPGVCRQRGGPVQS
jgi:hypothetical protein